MCKRLNVIPPRIATNSKDYRDSIMNSLANLLPVESDRATSPATLLAERLRARTATVAVIGLGYVGLPMADLLAQKGFGVIGFDIDPDRIAALAQGRRYIDHLRLDALEAARARGYFTPTGDFARLGEADVALICVPTPLGPDREPDLGHVQRAAGSIAAHLRPGMLVVLESTSYPGTCRSVVRPILERSGLRSGEDFFVACAPEREDPGNKAFTTATIPRVVGGDGPAALDLAVLLYGALVAEVVPVASTEVAEAVKITENVFRAVNIALVNELKTVYDAMGIDVWQVIAGAATKPFGYMPFHPGPGLGGHCVPIDPYYLAWKAREHGVESRFIELAGETNRNMPRRIMERLDRELTRVHGRGLAGSRILVVGLAYKRNLADVRESPGLRFLELLDEAGARADFHDPLVPEIPAVPESRDLAGRRSIPWPVPSGYDAALIVTDHDAIDYAALASALPLVVDTRNACESRGVLAANVVKA